MRTICLDVETHLIKAGCTAPRLVCMTTYDGAEKQIYLCEEALVVAREILLNDNVVTQHGFFDLCVLAAEDETFLPIIFDMINDGRFHCTRLRQQIIDNAEGSLRYEWNEETNEFKKQNYSLQRLVMRHLGKDIAHKKKGADIWRLRYNELDGVPLDEWPQDAIDYAIGDAVDTYDVFMSQDHYVGGKLPGHPNGEISQTQAGWALYLAGTWGVRTDGEAVAALKTLLSAEYNKHKKVAQKWKFIRTGVKESKNEKLIRAEVEKWYKKHEREIKYTDTGRVSIDRESLTGIECLCGFAFKEHSDDCDVDGVHRGLWAVTESVRIGKTLGTYVTALERGTRVPLNPNYNTIVETYRTSCSQGMKISSGPGEPKIPVGIQLQNPPRAKGVRECIIPRFGSMFAFCDFDTLEMRTLAQCCIELFGYSNIADAIREDRDLHVAMAANTLGLTYEEAWRRFLDDDEEIVSARQVMKPINYGCSGGMGPGAIVSYVKGYGIEITLKQAKALHRGFRDTWPEMVEYFRWCASQCKNGGHAKTVINLKSGLMRGRVRYTALCNNAFQHRAAMGAKDSLSVVSHECYVDLGTSLFGCRPFLFAHDEIGMEVPYTGKRASDAALRLKQVMEERMSWWCPDVPISATPSMSRRWRKGTPPLFINGILVPAKPIKNEAGKTIWVQDYAA